MPHEPLTGPERRAAATAEIRARTGIDDAMIATLVRAFYGRIQADPVLGPIFASRIAAWEPHLLTMMRFWSSVALLSGHYHGQPMPKHAALPIDGRHFDRWLALFRATARDVCPPAAAAHFIEKAERITESLELGLALSKGRLLRRGERYRVPDLDPPGDPAPVTDGVEAGNL